MIVKYIIAEVKFSVVTVLNTLVSLFTHTQGVHLATVPRQGLFAMFAYCIASQLCYLVHIHHGVKDTGILVSALYISKLIVRALNA